MSDETESPRSYDPGLFRAGILGLFWVTAPFMLGFVLLANLGPISDWLQGRFLLGLFAYMAFFALTSGTGLLPTYAQAILGGWVFGVAFGLPAALVGFLGGALVGFMVSRLVARNAVGRMIDRNPRWKVFREALVDKAFGRTVLVVSLLRLPPNSPFALTNLAMASTGVSLMPYMLGTLIGMTPRTAVAAYLAAQGRNTGARDIQELASESGTWVVIGGIVLMIIAFAIIGSIGRRAIASMVDQQ